MTLPDRIRRRLSLPVVCAPMFLISGPLLVVAARRAGFIGAFPRQNARTRAEFADWLARIKDASEAGAGHSGWDGPLAVNIPTTTPVDELAADLDLCAAYGVDIIITSVGKPDNITSLAHDRGLLVHHDATSVTFAEKAIEAGVDGLNCIGAGGGGHSGTLSPLVLLPRLREMFDGTLSLAGAVATGAAVRTAEVLGADLAFVGTRFAATTESLAHPLQKRSMVEGDSRRLRYTGRVNGVPANWMLDSLEQHAIDVDALPDPVRRGHDHLPADVRPWRDLWSAGQGVELIHDIPTVAQLARRLAAEYLTACDTPDYRPGAEILAGASERNERTLT
ncbi:NAD(P)H-dependent flavin oxidoreductase [Microbacterium immunditiarum]|uniref:Nitronate monooxygenase n=1 Tax=Microbacterium immunditiarum TaxID=337480 RepID=A0A7Y9GLR5_9MICO|nr:nitronate monooxygenase [Microbacterium immunditiarum]NYE18814.1 nitronate monooxygenase [Microbacterium immunditiarum]